VESENNGTRWEVEVVTDDGTEHKVDVSADGASVLRGPIEQQDSAADKAKHRDRVAAATLDYHDAVDALLKAVPNGRIDELNLDSERGTTVWEADVYDGSGTKHELSVDAATGTVLTGD